MAAETHAAVNRQSPAALLAPLLLALSLTLNHHRTPMTADKGSTTLLIFSCKTVVEKSLHVTV